MLKLNILKVGGAVVEDDAALDAFIGRFSALDGLKLLVHGGGFNWPEPDHFRVVYLPRVGELEEAMEKLEHFLKHYRQK